MRLRMGMVGGGLDAMAGELHRHAAALDSRVDFVAGALSSTPERSRAAAKAWGLARGYGSWREMLDGEEKLPTADRIEFVTVATPNHLHVPVSAAFAERGFHVACDKPEHAADFAARLLHAPQQRARERAVASDRSVHRDVVGGRRVGDDDPLGLVDARKPPRAAWLATSSVSGPGVSVTASASADQASRAAVVIMPRTPRRIRRVRP